MNSDCLWVFPHKLTVLITSWSLKVSVLYLICFSLWDDPLVSKVLHNLYQFSSVQSLSCVWLFATSWIAARQVSLSITNSWSSLKLTTIESVMPSSQSHPLSPPSDAYVRSFLYLLYTLIKLYSTKALSSQASSLAPDWILLLRRPRIPASLCGSTATFQ